MAMPSFIPHNTTHNISNSNVISLLSVCVHGTHQSNQGALNPFTLQVVMDNPPDGSLVQDLNDYLVDSPPVMNPQGHVVRHYTRVSDVGPDWIRCGARGARGSGCLGAAPTGAQVLLAQ